MEYVRLILTALLSLVALYLLTRLMGKKQIAQLNTFDYIVGITIGSIAAEMATETQKPQIALLAMAIYALVATGVSLLTNKSLQGRKILTGKPLLLLYNGEISRENLKKAKMDLSEFLMFCRIGGYYDLQQLYMVLLEHNGVLSFLPRAGDRPLTPSDVSRQPQQGQLWLPVIMDGVVLEENLRKVGKDPVWLQRAYSQQGYRSASSIFLALCDSSNQLQLFPMETKRGF